MKNNIFHGNCLDIMPTLPENSVDCVITDPPYGLSFMGKDWDHGVPGDHFWVEALRVAKPGAHLLAFGGTRTFHRLAVAIEDAGWEIRDTLGWLYGSGFPKSHNIGKAVDKLQGNERKEMINERWAEKYPNGPGGNLNPEKYGQCKRIVGNPLMTSRGTSKWEGWGTALKPAWEPIIMARKPFKGTVAENVLQHGTGAINVDGGRVKGIASKPFGMRKDRTNNTTFPIVANRNDNPENWEPNKSGRWPANILHDGSEEVLAVFPDDTKSGFRANRNNHKHERGPYGGNALLKSSTEYTKDQCAYDDGDGSAARFFYCAKASKAERDAGCKGIEAKPRKAYSGAVTSDPRMNHEQQRFPSHNNHPTVKPLSLMRYLCRLITPPDGIILDPFMGSGSTGMAAKAEGFGFIGIELNPEYIEIATKRIDSVLVNRKLEWGG